jgi:cell division transport system ATP-binding protein|tara:strand:- start:1901 stop:2554 length:654 start_codon:yes stop_codon:yes gene_type:complete
MIRLQNICKRYPESGEVLAQIDLQLEDGEMCFLTGPSGSGKSTLLKVIALIEAPTRGKLYFDERNVTGLNKSAISSFRKKMGLVFQDHRLLNDRNVFENVALPLRINGFNPKDIPRRVRAALDKVNLLNKEKARPISLSGGEQQRVGIARAIVHRPRLLLADEPTGNLDPELSADIMKLFSDFNQVGVTALIASHDVSLIKVFNKKILNLDSGYLVN